MSLGRRMKTAAILLSLFIFILPVSGHAATCCATYAQIEGAACRTYYKCFTDGVEVSSVPSVIPNYPANDCVALRTGCQWATPEPQRSTYSESIFDDLNNQSIR
jgi:hypothetical protein